MAERSTLPVPRDTRGGEPAAFSSVSADFGFGAPAMEAVAGRLVGKRLGDVTIESFIAAGGMGEVYRGREGGRCSPGRAVAVKVIRPDRIARGDLERFEQEILLLGRIDHPGIARILRGGVAAVDGRDVPHYVMELVVDGEPLVGHARRLGFGRDAIVETFLGVVEAMAACHRRRIVHRDLKPGNILVDADGRPKIVDFGVACLSGEATDRPAGTPSYMSPEQAAGETIDCRSDVYALGVVFHELLAGRRPHEFPNGSTAADIARAIRSSPPPALDLGDAALESIVATCLAADPTARFASARELGIALRSWNRGRPPRGPRRTRVRPPPRAERLRCERLEPKMALAAGPAGCPVPPVAVEPPALVLAPVRPGEPVSAGLLATVAPGSAVRLTAARLVSRLPDRPSRLAAVRNPRLARGGAAGSIAADGEGAWILTVAEQQAMAPTVLTVHFEIHDAGAVTPASAVVAVRPPAAPDSAAFAACAPR